MTHNLSITIKNYNKTVEVKKRTLLYDLLENGDKNLYIGALVNNEISSLSYSIKINAVVEFIEAYSHYGMEI